MRRRSGFTLIEMMIVLAIIAALAATLVPIAMNALNQAKVTGNLTDLESIRLAEMQYFYKKGVVTTNTGDSGLGVYLTWANLQGANEVNYTLSVNSADDDTVVINVPFNSNPLAKAFLAQWTDSNSGDSTADFASGDNTNIVVTYSFQ